MKKINATVTTLYIAIVSIMAIATFVEKAEGANFTSKFIYGSWWFTAIWTLLTVSGIALVFKQKLFKRPANFILHIALAVILTGALVTHIFGTQSTIHLRIGEQASVCLTEDKMHTMPLPFSITLNNFEIENYPGTQSPMDYISKMTFKTETQTVAASTSMNNIAEFRGYRFYQSGYDPDECGTYLSVAHDPVGIGITYAGYALLFISMLLLLIMPNESFRKILRKIAENKVKSIVIILILCNINTFAATDGTLKTIPSDVAKEFGNLYAYSNGRICPMQTVARNFTIKLYGRPAYKGLTAEQVLCGWILYQESWIDEPMIKLKGTARRIVGNGSKLASYNDFFNNDEYKLSHQLNDIFSGKQVDGAKSIRDADEKMNILQMLFNHELVKFFPYCTDSIVIWHSSNDAIKHNLSEEDQAFINNTISKIKEYASANEYKNLKETIKQISDYQHKTLTIHPSNWKIRAEHIFNTINHDKPLSMILTTIGILLFVAFTLRASKNLSINKRTIYILNLALGAATTYILLSIVLRGYIGGHLPLANGSETMQFMSLCALIMTLCLQRRFQLIIPFGFLISGLTLMVASFSESSPQITHLMPVLASPLLSVHVCVLMTAYTLLAFMMLNGITAIIIGKHDEKRTELLFQISKMMLYPALFLLTAGIFIGAIWANQSWGQYWNWDPKEVWALITMMIYAMPMHSSMFPSLQKPMNAHLFFAIAFLSVLITYFGVNFILGGMHSYA